MDYGRRPEIEFDFYHPKINFNAPRVSKNLYLETEQLKYFPILKYPQINV